jgi:PAS domain S-box-containing protein
MKQKWFNAAWFLSLILGLSLASFLAFSVWHRLDSINTAKEDHKEWLFSQLEVEYLKLIETLHYLDVGERNDLEPLRERFDIYYSRVDLAVNVQTKLMDPLNKIGALKFKLDQFIPVIDGPDEILRANVSAILDALESQRHIPREIAIASISGTAAASEKERAQIIFLIETLVAAIAITTALLIGATFILLRRSKSLRVVNEEAAFTGERLDSMLRASLDAVIVLDQFGTILETNGSAETVFKYKRHEMLGTSLVTLCIPERYQNRLNSYLQNYRTTGQTTLADKGSSEWVMLDANGREFPAEVVSTRAHSNEKTIFIAYIRDITKAKEKELEIVHMRDKALASYKEKSRFFAMMSHEMRTPLNGIISALQLLEHGALDSAQRRYLEAAKSSGDILMGHINDVLAIESIESEGEIELQPVDITVLTSTIFGAMTPFANASGVRFHMDQGGLDDRLVTTNPRALQQILVNLLSNAIKFSPKGKVTLAASFHETNETMTFTVKDTGIGISEADIKLIFDDFVSLDSTYERRTGGTGLGLGIVERQVNCLDGKIECISTLGEGASFIVTLPAIKAAKPQTVQTKIVPAADLYPRYFLVVDDNAVNRELLQAMLEQLGHRALCAQSGPEAIQFAQDVQFDAILMDISMPGMNGMEATHAIQSGNGLNSQTPCIAVTAHALPKQRAEFLAAGLAGFIEKPVRRETLKRVLHKICTEMKDPTQDAPGPSEIMTRSSLLDLSVIEEFRDVVGTKRFKIQREKFLGQVDHDLAELLSLHKLSDIRDSIHALAGLCALMGATQMHAIGCRIQDACDAQDSARTCTLLGDLSQCWPQTRLEIQFLKIA